MTRMQTHDSIVMLANRTMSPAAMAFASLVHDMMDPAGPAAKNAPRAKASASAARSPAGAAARTASAAAS